MNRGYKPPIHPLSVDISGYAVYPFVTNGGWIGYTFEDFANACAGAEVKEGLNIRFDEDRLRTPGKVIEEWAGRI